MEVVYLRFGELPEGGKSYNRAAKKLEAGVGVWEAIQQDGKFRILMPALKRECWEDAAVELHSSYGKPVFLVTGRVLKQTGRFGETLLTDVKVIEEVNPCAGRAWRELFMRPDASSEDETLEEEYE